MSLPTRPSILRTACRTVVWSRPPKRRPISGSERSVSVLARYMATWRGRTTLAVRREDRRSARLTLYWRATTRWISSILTRRASCGRIRSRASRSAISSVTGWPVSLLWASRRLSAPSRSRPLWVTALAMKLSTLGGTSQPGGTPPTRAPPGPENPRPQSLAEHAHLDDQPAGEPRAHAFVEALEV